MKVRYILEFYITFDKQNALGDRSIYSHATTHIFWEIKGTVLLESVILDYNQGKNFFRDLKQTNNTWGVIICINLIC